MEEYNRIDDNFNNNAGYEDGPRRLFDGFLYNEFLTGFNIVSQELLCLNDQEALETSRQRRGNSDEQIYYRRSEGISYEGSHLIEESKSKSYRERSKDRTYKKRHHTEDEHRRDLSKTKRNIQKDRCIKAEKVKIVSEKLKIETGLTEVRGTNYEKHKLDDIEQKLHRRQYSNSQCSSHDRNYRCKDQFRYSRSQSMSKSYKKKSSSRKKSYSNQRDSNHMYKGSFSHSRSRNGSMSFSLSPLPEEIKEREIRLHEQERNSSSRKRRYSDQWDSNDMYKHFSSRSRSRCSSMSFSLSPLPEEIKERELRQHEQKSDSSSRRTRYSNQWDSNDLHKHFSSRSRSRDSSMSFSLSPLPEEMKDRELRLHEQERNSNSRRTHYSDQWDSTYMYKHSLPYSRSRNSSLSFTLNTLQEEFTLHEQESDSSSRKSSYSDQWDSSYLYKHYPSRPNSRDGSMSKEQESDCKRKLTYFSNSWNFASCVKKNNDSGYFAKILHPDKKESFTPKVQTQYNKPTHSSLNYGPPNPVSTAVCSSQLSVNPVQSQYHPLVGPLVPINQQCFTSQSNVFPNTNPYQQQLSVVSNVPDTQPLKPVNATRMAKFRSNLVPVPVANNSTDNFITNKSTTVINNENAKGAIAKSFEVKKTSLSNLSNVSAEPDLTKLINIQKKTKVLSLCQDAIKALGNNSILSGRFFYKKTSKEVEKPIVKFQSSLRKIPVVRFVFTNPTKNAADTSILRRSLNMLLASVGIFDTRSRKKPKPSLSLVTAEVTAKQVKPKLGITNVSQTGLAKCHICEIRKSCKFTDQSTQCNVRTVDFGTQITSEEIQCSDQESQKDIFSFPKSATVPRSNNLISNIPHRESIIPISLHSTKPTTKEDIAQQILEVPNPLPSKKKGKKRSKRRRFAYRLPCGRILFFSPSAAINHGLTPDDRLPPLEDAL